MKSVCKLLLLMLMVGLAGCVEMARTTLAETYPRMYSGPPVAVLILPPVNNTTAAEAREYFSCSLSEALGLKGYYPMPVEAVFALLREEGLYETEILTPVVLANMRKHFGADAVLHTTINKWDKSWFLTSGSLTIDANFALLGTATGDTLWDYQVTSTVILGSSEKNLIAAAIESALKTAIEDYFPHARWANILAFREALPYGKYHPEAGLDGANEIPASKHGYLEISK